MELNTSQPQHSQIISKPSRNPILLIAVGVIVIVLVGLGLLVWQKNQEIGQALSQLADVEKQLSDSLRGNNTKQSGPAAEAIMMSKLNEDQQKDAAELVAAEYACSIKSFVCNKAEANVTIFQKVTDTTAGYAKVTVVSADGAKVTPWLIYRSGGSEWIVFYEGEALPSAAVTKQFDIPTDFLAVD